MTRRFRRFPRVPYLGRPPDGERQFPEEVAGQLADVRDPVGEHAQQRGDEEGVAVADVGEQVAAVLAALLPGRLAREPDVEQVQRGALDEHRVVGELYNGFLLQNHKMLFVQSHVCPKSDLRT